jgi:hypothetical protein
MPEPATTPVTPAAAPAPAQEAAPQATPPWGTEENFDPARAWNLIENLRAEKEQLAAKPRLTPEQQQQLTEYQRLVEASQSEAERQANAVAAAERAAETARAEAIRYKAAATYGVPQEHFDLLGSGTEEEVSARAEKIRALLAAQTAIAPPTATTPPTRPVEQLRPGATPSQADNEDDVIFASLFGKPA